MGELVSVIMPVYNAQGYVDKAINSLLAQTYKDLEIIIVDDGSTDGSFDICKEFSQKDERIKVFKNESNLGVVKTRNRLLQMAKGKYIALQDSDDISCSHRIRKQVEYLNLNHDVGMVGAQAVTIDERGVKKGRWYFDTDPERLSLRLFFHSPFLTSSVMIRKSTLGEDLFSEKFTVAEDYDLYCRLSLKSRVSNLSDYLVKYRIHSKGLSKKQSKLMEPLSIEVIQNFIKQKGLVIDKDLISSYRLPFRSPRVKADELVKAEKAMLSLKESLKFQDNMVVDSVFEEIWFEMCRKSTFNGFVSVKRFFQSELYFGKTGLIEKLRIIVRAILRV